MCYFQKSLILMIYASVEISTKYGLYFLPLLFLRVFLPTFTFRFIKSFDTTKKSEQKKKRKMIYV